jgi:hypothetical protein
VGEEMVKGKTFMSAAKQTPYKNEGEASDVAFEV